MHIDLYGITGSNRFTGEEFSQRVRLVVNGKGFIVATGNCPEGGKQAGQERGPGLTVESGLFRGA